MMKQAVKFLIAAMLMVSGPALAHDIKHGEMIVDHPIMHPPLGRPDMTVGYLRLVNKGDKADRLVSVTSEIADRIEIHTNIQDGDVMRMRKLDGVDIPAGAAIAFEPGSYHLMIFGLTEKLVTADEIPVTLEFEQAGKVTVPFWVEPRSAKKSQKPAAVHDGHDMGHDMENGEMDHEKHMDHDGEHMHH